MHTGRGVLFGPQACYDYDCPGSELFLQLILVRDHETIVHGVFGVMKLSIEIDVVMDALALNVT